MVSREHCHLAVIVPCFDEEATISSVLEGFRAALPEARLVVVDNNSVDDTARIAREHGATVLYETRQGKGHAVRKALREIDADVYVLVDGDDTYPPEDVGRLLKPIEDGCADVVIGSRLESASGFRRINRLGNRILLSILNLVFNTSISDLLSGYRALTREFVKQTPLLSSGFELETELTIIGLERGLRTVEVPIILRDRPAGSRSKLRVLRDGARILQAIFGLLRDYRPFTFFGGAGFALAFLGFLPGIFVTYEFTQRGTVRIPTAVLSTGLVLAGLLLVLVGVILQGLNRRFRELDQRLSVLYEQHDRAPER